ncbi:MAG: ABC transporter permease [Bacillota bacterium]|nr:ABC transporter permease [Bacillota bacterium]
MFRRIFAITLRDLKSGLRDYMILYVLIAPFLLAIILKAFVPSAGANLISVAVLDDADTAWVETLEQYGSVEKFKTRDELIRRVQDTDDVFAVIDIDGKFEVIAAGNETEGSREMVLSVINGITNQDLALPVTLSISDMGWRLSPLLQHGSNLIILFVSIFGGFVVMFGLVEEKQYKTLAAINVSAVSRSEYVIGKGILGFIMPILHGFGILLILGFTSIDYLKVSIVIISVALIGVIVGFVIGVWNDNQMTAVSSMKMTFLPLLGSVFGAIFLPDKWLPVLYWSPYYWAYMAVEGIILKQATWLFILRNCAVILLIAVIIFLLLQKKIRRGMA